MENQTAQEERTAWLAFGFTLVVTVLGACVLFSWACNFFGLFGE